MFCVLKIFVDRGCWKQVDENYEKAVGRNETGMPQMLPIKDLVQGAPPTPLIYIAEGKIKIIASWPGKTNYSLFYSHVRLIGTYLSIP
jgi:hypothetical protein